MKTNLRTFPEGQPDHNVRNFALAQKWKQDFEKEILAEIRDLDALVEKVQLKNPAIASLIMVMAIKDREILGDS